MSSDQDQHLDGRDKTYHRPCPDGDRKPAESPSRGSVSCDPTRTLYDFDWTSTSWMTRSCMEKDTCRRDPLLAPTALSRPVVVAQLSLAASVWAEDLAGDGSRSVRGRHPVHLTVRRSVQDVETERKRSALGVTEHRTRKREERRRLYRFHKVAATLGIRIQDRRRRRNGRRCHILIRNYSP
jgi:hypothetical protein